MPERELVPLVAPAPSRRRDKDAGPPVGTRCFYRNPALGLEGWGVIVEPRDGFDAEARPHLLPWRGTLEGPASSSQAILDALAPGCGVLLGEECYIMAPPYLLFKEA